MSVCGAAADVLNALNSTISSVNQTLPTGFEVPSDFSLWDYVPINGLSYAMKPLSYWSTYVYANQIYTNFNHAKNSLSYLYQGEGYKAVPGALYVGNAFGKSAVASYVIAELGFGVGLPCAMAVTFAMDKIRGKLSGYLLGEQPLVGPTVPSAQVQPLTVEQLAARNLVVQYLRAENLSENDENNIKTVLALSINELGKLAPELLAAVLNYLNDVDWKNQSPEKIAAARAYSVGGQSAEERKALVEQLRGLQPALQQNQATLLTQYENTSVSQEGKNEEPVQSSSVKKQKISLNK